MMKPLLCEQEWQRKSESWDVERCSLQQQIESLQTQNQLLADKCDMIAETSSDLRSQLERRREKLSGTEQGLKAQIVQLSTLLERSKDTISSQVRTLTLCVATAELLQKHIRCFMCEQLVFDPFCINQLSVAFVCFVFYLFYKCECVYVCLIHPLAAKYQ